MPDILSTVSSAIGLSKKLLELSSVAKNADAKLLIADLQLQLAEVKSALAELIGENSDLKEQLRQRDEPPEVVFKDGLYYTSEGDGPFCTSCYDTDGNLIRVAEMATAFRSHGRWRCNVCTAKYSGESE